MVRVDGLEGAVSWRGSRLKLGWGATVRKIWLKPDVSILAFLQAPSWYLHRTVETDRFTRPRQT